MQLHWAIQILFSWKDAHLHVFETEDGHSLDIDFPEYSFLVSEDDSEQSAEAEMERYLSIGEVFEQNRIIRYVYDPGNYWIHQIEFAGWKKEKQNRPARCILVSGVAMLENMNCLEEYVKQCDVAKDPSYGKPNSFPQGLNLSFEQRVDLPKLNKALEKL